MFSSKKSVLLNQKGETLLTILMAVGISMIVNFAMLEMFRNQAAGAKTTQQNYEANYLQNEIVDLFGNSKNCKANFPVGTVIDDGYDLVRNDIVKDVAGTTQVLYLPEQRVGNNTLQIPTTGVLTLKDLTPGTAPPNSTVEMRAILTVRRTGSLGSFFGSDTIARVFKIKVTTDGSRLLSDCSLVSGATNGIQRCRIGTTWYENNNCSGKVTSGQTDWSKPGNGVQHLKWNGGMNSAAATPDAIGFTTDPSCMKLWIECE